MNVIEKALKIMEQPVCNHCLGRQFARLCHGLTNEERGRIIRAAAAMAIDREDYAGSADLSNFHDQKFHRLEAKPQKKKCSVCGDLFEKLDKWISKIKRSSKNYEFHTFLIGTKLPFSLLEKEEALWERVGIDNCEPLKAEINREMGKLIEKELKLKFDAKNPDIIFILDFNSGTVKKEVSPLYIYGEYQKLVRGIPQTRWPSGKYKTSVEEIIAKPFMVASRGSAHKFHGLGREDIDARCLGWRPFVLEISEPKKRYFDFCKAAKKILKKIRVRKIRSSTSEEVRKIKELRVDKTYKATVICEKPVLRADLKKLNQLKEIKQRTPLRVKHRRADRYRKRKIKSLKAKLKTKKSFVLTIRGEAGLYIKELISGDSGRTEPSVSSVLKNKCRCKELDVIKIHI